MVSTLSESVRDFEELMRPGARGRSLELVRAGTRGISLELLRPGTRGKSGALYESMLVV